MIGFQAVSASFCQEYSNYATHAPDGSEGSGRGGFGHLGFPFMGWVQAAFGVFR